MTTLIARTAARLLGPIIIASSLYLLWRGHNAPGGGFIAALVAGAAIVLRFLTEGREGVRRALPIPPRVLFGSGLLVATLYGLTGMLFGEAFLEGALVTTRTPLGELKLAASLVFDVGVYLVVLGIVSSIIRYFGEEEEEER